MGYISWKPNIETLNKLEEQTRELADISLPDKYEDKISILVESLNPMLQTLEVNRPLTKFFIRWLGSKNLKKEGKLDPYLIADYLINSVKIEEVNFNWSTKVIQLQKKMIEITKLFFSGHFELKLPKYFKMVSVESLDKKLGKNYHTILSTLVLISQLENSENENRKKIIKDLKIWCLHYLVAAAKPPIIDYESDHCHYPFAEYKEDNLPHYHREDGGAIGSTFLVELQKKYAWLYGLQIHLIKNKEFRKHIINCNKLFTKNSDSYIKIESLNIEDFIDKNQTILNENLPILCLDFSPHVERMQTEHLFTLTKNPIKDIENFILSLLKFNNKFKNVNLIYGTVINIGNQDIYYFNGTDKNLLEQFKDNFKHIQASHGAYPEIMLLKRYLIELGYELDSLLDSYPIQQRKCYESYLKIIPIYTPKSNQEDVANEFNELINQLEKLNTTTQKLEVTTYFISLLLNWLNGISKTIIIEDSKVCYALILRIRKIKKYLNQETLSSLSFQDCLVGFHLIIENIQFLLIFFKVEQPKTLAQFLNNTHPYVKPEIDKQTFTFTSGIACYGNIADGLSKLFAFTPYVTLEAKSYYELTESTGSLRSCMEGSFHCHTTSLTNYSEIENLSNQNIIFTDRYPNRVVFKSVERIEIEKIITFILNDSNRQTAHPLVVIIDCSTSFFMHEEFQKLLTDFSLEIEDGRLIVLFTNSFAKYVMSGYDKFPAGIVQVYSSKKLENAKKLCNHLGVASDRDSLSPEANKTFYLLFKHCSTQILNYFEIIRKNTHTIYEILEKKHLVINENDPWRHPIHVGFRNKKIPMIGFHFDYFNHELFKKEAKEETRHIIVILMQYYLFAKFVENKLPITLKQSFGFASSNLTECWSALRFTVGLETELLDLYASIIVDVNKELNDILLSAFKKKSIAKIILRMSNGTKQLKDFIHLKQATILNYASCFEDMVNYLSNGTNMDNVGFS